MARSTPLLIAIGLVSCTRDTTSRPPPTPSTPDDLPLSALGAPPTGFGRAEPAPANPHADTAPSIDGTIVETMSSGGYTYARLESGGRQIWVAGPETALTVGATVIGARGTLMTAFRSNTLDRTFDEIYFINAFPGVKSAAPADPSAPNSRTKGPQATPSSTERIAKVTGGHTIADLFANQATLANTAVAVRGKVVKYNRQILGHNWLHLQDGTGSAGTDDLTVTTDADVELGAIVVVRGTLATKRDFGAGYKYDVLVENATVSPN